MKIYFKGVPVGSLKSAISVENGRYSIAGFGKTNSVVSIVAKTRGSFKSNGDIQGRSTVPKTQSSTFRRGKKRGKSRLTFQNSNVVDVSVTPPIKYKRGTVPVTPAHFRDVIDPVSSLLFPLKKGETASGSSVCNRTIPVFNGKSRMDLVFKFKSSKTASIRGFKGTVYTCSVKYKPVAGHRPKSKSTRFMMARNDIEVSMAEIGETGLFALFGFSVPIRQGIISGIAENYIVK